MWTARNIHHLPGPAYAVDGLGYEPARPRGPGRLDLRDSVAPSAFRFLQNALVAVGQGRIVEKGSGLGRFIIGQIYGGRSRLMRPKKIRNGFDGGCYALYDRITMAGLRGGGPEHDPQGERSIVTQYQHEPVESAGHTRGKKFRAGNEVEAERGSSRPRAPGHGRRSPPDDHARRRTPL